MACATFCGGGDGGGGNGTGVPLTVQDPSQTLPACCSHEYWSQKVCWNVGVQSPPGQTAEHAPQTLIPQVPMLPAVWVEQMRFVWAESLLPGP